MEELTYETKVAVLRILNEIIYADKVVHQKEVDYLKELVCSFGLSNSYQDAINAMPTLQALTIIKSLDPTTKGLVAQLMGKMVVVDEDINYNEVQYYNMVCEACHIDNDFHVDDYPDYSLSGPFVNPEDLMTTMS